MFSMFYSILVGEEPDSVLLKKERKQNQVKMIRINPFFLRQRSYHFRRNWSYISFQFPFKSSYVFPRPFETSKKGQIPFLRFLGTHTRFVTTKRIMVTPKLTTEFLNLIVIEIHVLPRQNFELAILLPSRQSRGKTDSFGST